MTATDLPAGGTTTSQWLGACSVREPRTANADECQWSYPPLPHHSHDNFDVGIFRPIGQQALMTFLRGAKSVIGTCGHCIPWFDAPRSYCGIKNEASRD
jgi:hypothetical protein